MSGLEEVRAYLDGLLAALEEAEYATSGWDDALGTRRALTRLAGAARSLIIRHRVDERGRCRICRTRACTVHATLTLFLIGPLPVVWWQIFSHTRDNVALDEVRAWLATHPPPNPDRHDAPRDGAAGRGRGRGG